jgi:hypothetical protein
MKQLFFIGLLLVALTTAAQAQKKADIIAAFTQHKITKVQIEAPNKRAYNRICERILRTLDKADVHFSFKPIYKRSQRRKIIFIYDTRKFI